MLQVTSVDELALCSTLHYIVAESTLWTQRSHVGTQLPSSDRSRAADSIGCVYVSRKTSKNVIDRTMSYLVLAREFSVNPLKTEFLLNTI
jgi:hypothetical protein